MSTYYMSESIYYKKRDENVVMFCLSSSFRFNEKIMKICLRSLFSFQAAVSLPRSENGMDAPLRYAASADSAESTHASKIYSINTSTEYHTHCANAAFQYLRKASSHAFRPHSCQNSYPPVSDPRFHLRFPRSLRRRALSQ